MNSPFYELEFEIKIEMSVADVSKIKLMFIS